MTIEQKLLKDFERVSGYKLSDIPTEIKISEEYFFLPKEVSTLIKEGTGLFIHKHGNLDNVLRGGDLLRRGEVERVVNNSLIVARVTMFDGPMNLTKDSHIFLGLIGIKNSVVNGYIHEIKDNLIYIGCMGNDLL